MYYAVKFVPSHQKSSVVNNIQLCDYDNEDSRAVDEVITRTLITGVSSRTYPEAIPDTEKRISTFINMYTHTGDVVFSDKSIVIGEDTAFEGYVDVDRENDITMLYIFCGPGSANLLINGSSLINGTINWLLDYMVKSLGEEVAVNTALFKKLWMVRR